LQNKKRALLRALKCERSPLGKFHAFFDDPTPVLPAGPEHGDGDEEGDELIEEQTEVSAHPRNHQSVDDDRDGIGHVIERVLGDALDIGRSFPVDLPEETNCPMLPRSPMTPTTIIAHGSSSLV
jgi:hypothetical protein